MKNIINLTKRGHIRADSFNNLSKNHGAHATAVVYL